MPFLSQYSSSDWRVIPLALKFSFHLFNNSNESISFLKLKKKNLTVPHGMQDLSSPSGIEPAPPAVEAQSPNHWSH